MDNSRRHAGFGAVAGAAIGTVLAMSVWRTLAATGAPPAYLLESVAFVAALPFGVVIAYPVAAVTGVSPGGLATWSLLTPTLNWALVGLLIGAVRDILVSNRAWRRARHHARSSSKVALRS